MNLKQISVATLLAASAISQTAQADVGFGGGITYIFGQGFAVGIKAFTNNDEDEATGSIGLDYVLPSGGWRPNIGVGYLGNNVYGDFNAGYNTQSGTWDFGVGAGGANTKEDKGVVIIDG